MGVCDLKAQEVLMPRWGINFRVASKYATGIFTLLVRFLCTKENEQPKLIKAFVPLEPPELKSH